jgi:hypothetical protein
MVARDGREYDEEGRRAVLGSYPGMTGRRTSKPARAKGRTCAWKVLGSSGKP